MQLVNISQSYNGNMDRYEKISNSVQEILVLGVTAGSA